MLRLVCSLSIIIGFGSPHWYSTSTTHPDILTLLNSTFYLAKMLLHLGALLIFSCSTYAIAHASADTDKDTESSTLLSVVVEQDPWKAHRLELATTPYVSIPLYREPTDSGNPSSFLPADIFQTPVLHSTTSSHDWGGGCINAFI